VGDTCLVSGQSPPVSGSLSFAQRLVILGTGRINVVQPGVTITVTAGEFLMRPGSVLTGGDAATCGGGTPDGAPITITVNGNVETSVGSTIRSNGCSGGAISITTTGAGQIAIGGLVESAGGRTGTGAVQGLGGGAITLKAGCLLTVANTARVSSRGRDPGADLVHLEGCEVTILGLVESTGNGHGPPNNPANHCVLPGKSPSSTACVQIWSGGTVLIDSTPAADSMAGNAGEINADIGFAGGSNGRSWIEIFAAGGVTIRDGTGNDHPVEIPGGAPVPSTFAVHANMMAVTNANGGLINITSTTADVVASGDAVQASGRPAEGGGPPGGNGGEIHIEANRNVTLNGARIFAQGDIAGTGGFGNGGHIGTTNGPVRAFNGPLSWTSGTGDAQPTGSPLMGGASGAINLRGCGPVNATASFPVTQGSFSPAITTECGGAPTLPSYVVLPANCSQTCNLPENGRVTGVKWNDLNGNGVRDPGEPGLAGWTIHVFTIEPAVEHVHVLTGLDGTYSIGDLPPGTYDVRVFDSRVDAELPTRSRSHRAGLPGTYSRRVRPPSYRHGRAGRERHRLRESVRGAADGHQDGQEVE
jgi:hypothetical protein